MVRNSLVRSVAAAALATTSCAGQIASSASAASDLSGLRPTLNAPCLRGQTCIEHVLLISVDGFHEVDLELYIAEHPHSALRALADRSKRYDEASTSAPSDSFPGLLARVTGGNPKTTGVYDDDPYDKTLFKPGSACEGARGTEVLYDESIDRNSAALDGGGAIDRAKLPLELSSAGCKPFYPHSSVRVNTIFEAIRGAGGYTA